MKLHFLLESITLPGFWAVKGMLLPIAPKRLVPLLPPNPNQLFIHVKLMLSGAVVGVLGKKYYLTLEVSGEALPT